MKLLFVCITICFGLDVHDLVTLRSTRKYLKFETLESTPSSFSKPDSQVCSKPYSTDTNYAYNTWFPVSKGPLYFSVKGDRYIHVALSPIVPETNPLPAIYEIVLNGWTNNASGIRRSSQGTAESIALNQYLLSSDSYKTFVIDWTNGTVKITQQGEVEPFLMWTDPNPLQVNYYSVTTGFGYSGEWLLDCTTGPLVVPICKGGWVNSSSGIIVDGSATNSNYANDLSCATTIQVLKTRQIFFQLTGACTEENYDYVRIYDGPTTSSPILFSYSGCKAVSWSPIVSTSNVALVTWTTDFSNTATGFTLKWNVEGCKRDVFTPNFYTYLGWTDMSNRTLFEFEVLATSNAYIALSPVASFKYNSSIYEIVIGSQSNTRTSIRRSKQGTNLVQAATPGILSGSEFKGFWIDWSGGEIKIGSSGNTDPFLRWTDSSPLAVRYVGVSTDSGVNGTWRVNCYDDPLPMRTLTPVPIIGGTCKGMPEGTECYNTDYNKTGVCRDYRVFGKDMECRVDFCPKKTQGEACRDPISGRNGVCELSFGFWTCLTPSTECNGLGIGDKCVKTVSGSDSGLVGKCYKVSSQLQCILDEDLIPCVSRAEGSTCSSNIVTSRGECTDQAGFLVCGERPACKGLQEGNSCAESGKTGTCVEYWWYLHCVHPPECFGQYEGANCTLSTSDPGVCLLTGGFLSCVPWDDCRYRRQNDVCTTNEHSAGICTPRYIGSSVLQCTPKPCYGKSVDDICYMAYTGDLGSCKNITMPYLDCVAFHPCYNKTQSEPCLNRAGGYNGTCHEYDDVMYCDKSVMTDDLKTVSDPVKLLSQLNAVFPDGYKLLNLNDSLVSQNLTARAVQLNSFNQSSYYRSDDISFALVDSRDKPLAPISRISGTTKFRLRTLGSGVAKAYVTISSTMLPIPQGNWVTDVVRVERFDKTSNLVTAVPFQFDFYAPNVSFLRVFRFPVDRNSIPRDVTKEGGYVYQCRVCGPNWWTVYTVASSLFVGVDDTSSSFEVFLKYPTRWMPMEISVFLRLPTPHTIGNELWLDLPDDYDFDQCDTNNCTTIASVGADLQIQPKTVRYDRKQKIVQLNWDTNITLVNTTQIRLRNIRVPNRCNDMTYQIIGRTCYLEDLFGAGVYFVRKCPEWYTYGQKWTRVHHETDSNGTPKGCSFCNGCNPIDPDPVTGAPRHYICSMDGVNYLRTPPLAPCTRLSTEEWGAPRTLIGCMD